MRYSKRLGFETQRAKPWHIIKPDSIKEDVFCGAWRHWAKVIRENPEHWHAKYTVAVDEIPEGQIICSVCERVQNKIPPFQKKEKS